MIGSFALAIAGVNVIFIFLGSRIFNPSASRNFLVQLFGFLLSGGLGGGILAFALFEIDITKILQGALGGVIAAALIGLMVPKTLSKRLTATLAGPTI
jgi:hypothetical protein